MGEKMVKNIFLTLNPGNYFIVNPMDISGRGTEVLPLIEGTVSGIDNIYNQVKGGVKGEARVIV